MKVLHNLILLLVALVAYTSAQGCGGRRTCNAPRNVGRGGRGCHAGTMWYYDSRSRRCQEMRYLGCGGNNNRYCTRIACVRRCERRGG